MLRMHIASENTAMMTPPPEPCTDRQCQGRHDSGERIALAASICASRGVKLTTLRRQILQLLWDRARPTGAYELIETLKGLTDRQIGPPTVYRALGFLMTQGLVSKIESKNAYVPCAHPERSHVCLFFICNHCGASLELEDERLADLIAESAALLGFRTARPLVEVDGLCAKCIGAGAA